MLVYNIEISPEVVRIHNLPGKSALFTGCNTIGRLIVGSPPFAPITTRCLKRQYFLVYRTERASHRARLARGAKHGMPFKDTRGISFKRFIRTGIYTERILAAAADQILTRLGKRAFYAVVARRGCMVKIGTPRLAFFKAAGVTFFKVNNEFFHNQKLLHLS